MSFELPFEPEELRDRFYNLGRPEDIADLLDVAYRDLVYWIYRTPESKRYESFTISKKSGAPRRIDAPTTNIKILQQKPNQVLQAVYRPRASVHGFAVERSVKTNADQHSGRRYVLNLDLRDFFPSINFDSLVKTRFEEVPAI